jgi:DNA-binding NtrC family response regulator
MSEKQSILLVDDDRQLCISVGRTLQRFGYDVTTAHDGGEALDILAGTTVDLVISDLRMPNVNGIELMEEIKRRKIDVPVVFLTAYGEVESYMDLMNMGAFDYLNKPIDVEELLNTAKKILQSRQTQR